MHSVYIWAYCLMRSVCGNIVVFAFYHNFYYQLYQNGQ